MNNIEVAELLRAVAAAYQVRGKSENRFKIIAYQRAADAVEHLSSEVKDLWDEGKLTEVAGIGEGISEHLGEIFKRGRSRHFERIMKELPETMFELIKVQGIGPKTAYRLAREFKMDRKKPIEALLELAKRGRIAKLEGFGKDSEGEIIRSIEEYLVKPEKRLLLPYAEEAAREIMEWMKKDKRVFEVNSLGSLRRKTATVGDIDIAAATSDPKGVIEHFCQFPKAKRVLEKGVRTASMLLPGNIQQVDLMVQSPEAYGALLQHFTGSKHHNIALREYALKKGLSLSEYGIKKLKIHNFKSQINSKIQTKNFKTEEDFYKALGMEWIPPELREDTGEIEAAFRQTQGKQPGLPRLVEVREIKGDLQIHSDFEVETSHDLGESSIEEIVKKADQLGYEYVALTEHNPSKSGHSDKQIREILKRKGEKVEEFNYSLNERRSGSVRKVFNSLEIDILPDGRLPVSELAMESLDFALVSIHSSFRMSRAKMTERVLRGLNFPRVKIFAHPTARKLNEREAIELDWEKIFQFCVEEIKWVEINADPMRLDLPDFLVREAVKKGVKMTLGTDAHHRDAMEKMRYGVDVARRGWAEKKDIINTRDLKELEEMLE